MAARLPPGASLDPEQAREIARDDARLAAAHAFWKAQLDERGEDPFGAQDTPAVELAKRMPYAPYAALLPARSHLFDETREVARGGDQDFLTDRAGCLLSAAELDEEIGGDDGQLTIWDDLKAFAAAAAAPPAGDVEAVARGVRFCRELADVARRLFFCRQNADEFAFPVSECLALYFQETGLFVTPGADSYPHAPLIQTYGAFSLIERVPDHPPKPRGCRIELVALFDESARRPGCNLTYQFRQLTTAVRTEPLSLSFDLFLRNLTVTGGLDSIMNPRLPERDELLQLHAAARRNPFSNSQRDGSRAILELEKLRRKMSPVRDLLGDTQRETFDDMIVGLLMAEIDRAADLPPVETLLDNVRAEMVAHLDANRTVLVRRGSRRFVHILGDRLGTDTYRCLRVQMRWYGSRTDLRTLVARADRRSLPRQPRLSPFMSYLRFHSGDSIFLGVLLRTLLRLEAVAAHWRANAGALGDALPRALDATRWVADGGALRTELETDLNEHWATAHVGSETAWRHGGLLAELKSAQGVPRWLRDLRRRAPTARQRRTAGVALKVIKGIVDFGLQPAVSIALEHTPIGVLVDNDVLPTPPVRDVSEVPAVFLPGAPAAHRIREFRKVRARAILAKSHNFERVRLVYADALAAAGIPD